MKQFNLFKNLFFVALLFAAGIVNAQVHPLGFGPHTLSGTTSLSSSNWFADYVGARLVVTNPTAIAGQYDCASAEIGTGTSQWPNIVWPSGGIINVPIVMQSGCDSFGGATFGTSCAGKIAVIWRGPVAGGCYSGTTYPFTQKAQNAQLAGAIAIVIINEYAGQAAFVPGFSTGFSTVTIPVVMIGNTDGIAISASYHSNPAGTVKMSITPWGLGNANDLGLVPSGAALYQYYAIPKNQLVAGNASLNYLGVDGAFVGNFGSHKATGTKLKSVLSFTPSGSTTATVEHSDSLIFEGDFVGVAHVPAIAATDTSSDSIMAMFSSASTDEYSLAATTAGRYDLKYTLSSDSVDQYPADNTTTTSFYVTDTLFSRARYDFTKNVPLSNSYEGYSTAGEITWGDYFYIGNAGYHVGNIQYNVSNGRTGAANLVGSNDIYVFSWTDGSNGQTLDSLVQDGELDLVSWTTHAFVSGVDTSMATITQTTFNDSADLSPKDVNLAANTWYYIAIDLPAATSDTLFLGVDGVNNAYPRMFARWWDHGQTYLDYSNTVGTNASAFTSNLAQAEAPLPFTQASFVNVVDSFSWTNVKGLVPSIALNMTNHVNDTGSTSHVGVNNQVKSAATVSIYPNPATDHLNVSVNLDHSSSVTYKVIDGLGRAVSKEIHDNVLNETFSINTTAYRAGTYFLLISADGQLHTSKKFTVIK